jgi:hypothetical protein
MTRPGHYPYTSSLDRPPSTESAGSMLQSLSKAPGLSGRQAMKLKGYKHAEAFCLTLYQCTKCIHREVIWNSRDGVTAFGMGCPTCGQASLQHHAFGADWCVPDHVPYFGQRVWVDMTRERAEAIARMRISRLPEILARGDMLQQYINDIYRNGQAPDLVVCGYGWSFQATSKGCT